MKPMIILPLGVMDLENVKLLRDNGICVVIAKDPAKLKFLDPIPALSQRTQIEHAAIKLSRILLNGQWGNYSSSGTIGRGEIARIYADMLIEGTPLDRNGSREEQEQRIIDQARIIELQKIAREEARAESAKRKAEKAVKESSEKKPL